MSDQHLQKLIDESTRQMSKHKSEQKEDSAASAGEPCSAMEGLKEQVYSEQEQKYLNCLDIHN